ncbi:hypothetical protein SAMN04487831_10821 [Pseudobutyrivibrio sp. UC1225]|uniref:hypothetical protein n=1 Tax=Pseudobutyrivibrio sp. UC1225 TaxID=1798185 RepID=UPI0008F26E76|nr:hypothetical protein [Pseudobutyrivibrio sp. UC1225]SFO09525.1 hypothetical protein SAMN04487831_10821 [Pseudobutyrivibrio sp. UC1225]
MKRVIVSAMTLFFIVSFIGCGTNNKEGTNIIGGADEPSSIVLESTVGGNESFSKEEFDADNIQINKLPQKIYDYSEENALDFEKYYVRLEVKPSEDLKIYGVGDNEQKTVLLVYKDKYFYTGWETDPGLEIYSYLISDLDGDGEDEIAVCTNEDVHHTSLYVVELSDENLWKYQKLDCYDENIDKYIWENLSYTYDKEDNAIVFVSRNGKNTIKYSGDALPDNCAEILAADNVVPETLNERRMYLGGQNEVDLVMDVSVDYVQGTNYGEAIIKLSYDEDGITFSGFDFLNNTDLSY